ncbi:hypothetical protein HDU88_008333 [Geranomyces variabilis]|nr:hypothetical protein HDU88_008333 [Geranomyces variabilis]
MSNTLFTKLDGLLANQPRISDAPLHIPHELLAAQGVQCTSIAVLDGPVSSDIHTKIYAPTSTPTDSDTVFQACSISKPLAAMAIMRLVQSGKLTLDDKMVDYLTPAQVKSMMTPTALDDAFLKQITVKQLMSHTSGLSVDNFDGYLPPAPIPTPAEVLAGSAPANNHKVHLVGIPGRQWSYSGGAYTVLLLIIEKATGEDFASAMKRLVLDPLGMRRSFYGEAPVTETNYAKGMYTGYTQTDGNRSHPELPAGGLWTTPTDILLAVLAIQRALLGKGDFLNKHNARLMLTPVMHDVALGWWSNETESSSWRKFSHTGGKGIAIMTNSNIGYHAIITKLFAAIAHLNMWPAEAGPTGGSYVDLCRQILPERYRAWMGDWTGDWRIKDGPVAHWKDGPGILLFPAAVTEKRVKASYGKEEETLTFVLSPVRIVLRFTWNDRGERIVEVFERGVRSTIQKIEAEEEGDWEVINGSLS